MNLQKLLRIISVSAIGVSLVAMLGACLKAQAPKELGASSGQADATNAAGTSTTCPQPGTSYSATAQPVIQKACVACHATRAPLMNTPAEVAAQGSAIVAAAVAGRMPPGGGLIDADLQALQNWADGGFAQLRLAAVSTPTYEGAIKPMVMAKCAWCHSASAAADVRTSPYLTNYTQVKAQAKSMYEKMNQKEMPPQGVVPALASDDAAIFAAWRSAGYPQGTAPVAVPAGQAVYYLGTIDALFAANCTGCHKPGVTAPDLSNYQAVEALGTLVLAAIQSGRMPPSGPLAADLKAEFQAWSVAGYPYDGNGTIPPAPESISASGSVDSSTSAASCSP